MTVDDVRNEVEELKRFVGDNEGAHQFEDGIYIGVLRAIAEGTDDAPGLAAEALRARDVDYDRWYA